MSEQILQNFLDETTATFKSYKKLAEKALEQVSDEEFFTIIDAESNNLAMICKHLGGNLRSRWADFLTADGEKPDRDRDSEFVTDGETREGVMNLWETGWGTLFGSLKSLTTADLGKTTFIRTEEFTVVRAINRSLSHTAYHVGQIAFLAKHLRSTDWKTLSIPRNTSEEFREYLSKRADKGNYLESTRDFTDKMEKEKSGRRE